MMKLYRLAPLILLSACAVLPPSTPDEPLPPRSDNTAVVALLETARQDTAAGRLESAAATLERALRIEPRNASLWNQLARVRLQQGQPGQTIQLATKSNSLATDNNRLRADNWRLIGEARASRGDHAGAEAAFAKAEELYDRR